MSLSSSSSQQFNCSTIDSVQTLLVVLTLFSSAQKVLQRKSTFFENACYFQLFYQLRCTRNPLQFIIFVSRRLERFTFCSSGFLPPTAPPRHLQRSRSSIFVLSRHRLAIVRHTPPGLTHSASREARGRPMQYPNLQCPHRAPTQLLKIMAIQPLKALTRFWTVSGSIPVLFLDFDKKDHYTMFARTDSENKETKEGENVLSFLL